MPFAKTATGTTSDKDAHLAPTVAGQIMTLKLLCVTAHPDDEAANFGGTLLGCAGRGVATYVICLTPGQAATHRGGARSESELAEMRRQEFAASCRLLKVTHAEVLDYRDGGLDRVDFHDAIADLTARIRKLQPQVVLTMGAEGGVTGHPDHSMACLITTLAYHWAGRRDRFPEQLKNSQQSYRPQKLYHATTNFTIPDRPPLLPSPITTTIHIAEYLETKIAAFKLHTSQSPLFTLFEGLVRQRGGKEYFHLAAAISPRQIEHETDLFAGVFS
jgi:LmbE family N-acetylglucosaminyl deacetylase